MKLFIVFRGPNNYYVLEEEENPDRTYKNKPIAAFYDKDLAFEYVYHKNGKNVPVKFRKKKEPVKWENELDMPDKYFSWTNEILNG